MFVTVYTHKVSLDLMHSVLSLTVVTVGFGRNVTQVNESDMTFMMCVVKDRVTTRPLQLQIQDQPNSALRSLGILSLTPSDYGGHNPPQQKIKMNKHNIMCIWHR